MIDGCDDIQKALMLTSPPPITHLAQVADLRCGWRRISISVGVSEARQLRQPRNHTFKTMAIVLIRVRRVTTRPLAYGIL